MRHACVLIHRYAGLAMALFLIVAGITGSIMAFEDEIDAWLMRVKLFRPLFLLLAVTAAGAVAAGDVGDASVTWNASRPSRCEGQLRVSGLLAPPRTWFIGVGYSI